MIRLLKENDISLLMEYLNMERDLNIFAIGDIENYGFNRDFQKVWGEFDDDGRLTGVLLKHYGNFLFYSRHDYSVKDFISILINEGFNKISGEASIMKKFESAYNFSGKLDDYICRLDSDSSLIKDDRINVVQSAGLKDVEKIIDLYNSVEEFKIYGNKPDNIIRRLQDKTGRAYYIESDNKFIAAAQTSAEGRSSAMIVGVSTHDDYRKRGYSSICLSKLCLDLLNEGKTPYLLYDNPAAGFLYKKLGFETIGICTSYFK